ncbi:alpha/beta fold hydrolase [Nocardia sp. JMUB6875]|uniref:alpha/beta fold hydrolase n=1 Tax=Nocardia sp. JMUB6875 TaxID=3158170 RepID=UPI0034E8F454
MSYRTGSVVSADGTRIVFHTGGDGPPLVIVHGALVPLDVYMALGELLASDYRVVVVERRDYGGPSGNGPRPATFTTQAFDLAAVLAEVGEPAFVFGHSAGGLVTLHAMQRDSSSVRGLALYEPPATLAGPPLRPTLATIRDFMADGRPVDAVHEFLTAITDSAPPGFLRRLAESLASRASGLVADLECLTTMNPDITPWSGIDIPALLLNGELTDTYGKNSVDLLRSTLPQAHSLELAGQRHHPDDPVPLATALRDFFV